MNRSSFRAICRFAIAIALTFVVPVSGQIVEKTRTWADLLASHPCSSGLIDRHTIVKDCDAADDVGDGGGAFECFVKCDGTAPWENAPIGGGGGGAASNSFETINLPAGTDPVAESATDTLNVTCAAPLVCTGTAGTDTWAFTFDATLGNVVGPASATDLGIPIYDGTTGKIIKASALTTIADDQIVFGTSGSINGAAGDILDFRDSTNSSVSLRVSHATGIQFDDDVPITFGATAFGAQDVGMNRASAGIMKFTDGSTGGGAIDVGDPGARPACDSTKRGVFWVDEGGAGVADTVSVCAKDVADAYDWHDLY